MYWPLGSPTVLTSPTPPTIPPSRPSPTEPILHTTPNRTSSLFLTLTRSTLALWSSKPAVVLSLISRSPHSIEHEGGANRECWFGWDSGRVVVLTEKGWLIQYRLVALGDTPYGEVEAEMEGSSLGKGERKEKTFMVGPGEGGEMLGWGMDWEGSWDIAGGVTSLAPHPNHLLLTLTYPTSSLISIPYPIPHDLSPIHPPIRLPLPPSPPGLHEHPVSISFSRPLALHVMLTSIGNVWLLHPTNSPNHHRPSHVPGPSVSNPRRSVDFSFTPDGPSRRDSFARGEEKGKGKEAQLLDFGARRVRLEEGGRGLARGASIALASEGKATVAAINAKFSLLAVGTESGLIHLHTLPLPPLPPTPHLPLPLSLPRSTNSSSTRLFTGPVTSLAWTPDGYALAVGWARGWGLWSTGARLLAWGMMKKGDDGEDESEEDRGLAKEDRFLRGVESDRGLLWLSGGLELLLLAPPAHAEEPIKAPNNPLQLFLLPFAKSSFTTLPTPSSTLYPLLLLPSSLLLSTSSSLPSSRLLSSISGPSTSTTGIAPWLPIALPHDYIASQHPVRYATASEDGRLVAVAGRRGLCHWSRGSGRWKLFGRPEWEEEFRVVGGLVWFEHVLIAGVEIGKEHCIRLYSRDDSLTPSSHLLSVSLPSSIHLLSLHANSLLVYTLANTFYHFLIVPTEETVELRLCGSISFEGVVAVPGRVRGMSWLIPLAQKKLGHPSDDLPLATVIFLIDSSLVLLRPRKASRHHRRKSSLAQHASASEEVKYDLQILADRIESYWTHLSGIGTLENSLWGWDGEKLRVWLDALTVDRVRAGPRRESALGLGGGLGRRGRDSVGSTGSFGEEKGYERVGESVSMPLDFYPLSVLMDKGIIIGLETDLSLRSTLPFSTYKLQTSTHLFLPHILRFHLSLGQIKPAVRFASFFQHLSYFAHALEILLHGVLEQECDEGPVGRTPLVDEGEEGRWGRDVAERELSALSPIAREVLEGTMEEQRRESESSDKSMAPFLEGGEVEESEHGMGILPLVVEFLDHFPQALDVVVGCARKTEVTRWGFLFDVVGKPRDLFEICLSSNLLVTATSYLLVLHNLEQLDDSSNDTVRLLRAAMRAGEWNLCKDLLRFLHSIDESGGVLRAAMRELGILASELTMQLEEDGDEDGRVEGVDGRYRRGRLPTIESITDSLSLNGADSNFSLASTVASPLAHTRQQTPTTTASNAAYPSTVAFPSSSPPGRIFYSPSASNGLPSINAPASSSSIPPSHLRRSSSANSNISISPSPSADLTHLLYPRTVFHARPKVSSASSTSSIPSSNSPSSTSTPITPSSARPTNGYPRSSSPRIGPTEMERSGSSSSGGEGGIEGVAGQAGGRRWI